jgi:hypothetical protein
MPDFTTSDTALIVGFVLAAIVGTVVYVGIEYLLQTYGGLDPPPPLSAEENNVMLRNHEAIKWIRDQQGRVQMITIDREVG